MAYSDFVLSSVHVAHCLIFLALTTFALPIIELVYPEILHKQMLPISPGSDSHPKGKRKQCSCKIFGGNSRMIDFQEKIFFVLDK